MISIIIPVYNTAYCLDRCLQSVIDRDFNDWECFLIDDGSTDGSSLICDKWAVRDSHFKVVHQANKGVSCSRNVGIDLSKGEWLLFLDSDDYCIDIPDPEFCLDADLILGSYYSCGKVVRPYRLPASEIYNYALSYLQDNVRCCIGSYLARRSLIEDHSIRFTEGCRYGEDMEFNFKMFLYSKSVTFSDNCFSCYQQSQSSATRRLTTDKFDVFYSRLRLIEEAGKNNNKEARAYLENHSLIEAVVEPAKVLLRGGMNVCELSSFIKGDDHIVQVLKTHSSSNTISDKYKAPAWLLLHIPIAYKLLLNFQDAKYNVRAWLGGIKRKMGWIA